MMKYFADDASDDLKEGATIKWRWNRYGEYPVIVKRIVENKLVELTLDSREWDKTKDEAYDVRIVFEFTELEEGGTMLSISEEGWKSNADGLKGSHDNCSGWTHMAMCLKAWLEHDIDLR
jgi:uncharacterized protein YndB with AHSA1/START domain